MRKSLPRPAAVAALVVALAVLAAPFVAAQTPPDRHPLPEVRPRQRADAASSTRTTRRPSWPSTSGTTSARRTRSRARPASPTSSST
ncbi:MAG: hypothetical protein MZV64_10645 [Ignavibacteriales bacterium]|nr:hypothetical protein [Ignavibacteriales bacterium]